MKRLRLGTKGANVRAIGRFGKGLKSVYAFCEAYQTGGAMSFKLPSLLSLPLVAAEG